ncbi:4811_t:CDS:2, partial [Scutellospora calospora]
GTDLVQGWLSARLDVEEEYGGGCASTARRPREIKQSDLRGCRWLIRRGSASSIVENEQPETSGVLRSYSDWVLKTS